jgi:hypothetical protein
MIHEACAFWQFLQELPGAEFWTKEIDDKGEPLVYPVEEQIARWMENPDALNTPVRVVWNDKKNVAVVVRSVLDPNEAPDRAATVFLHQDVVHGVKGANE